MTQEQAAEFFNQLVKLQEQIDSLKQEAYPETDCNGHCGCGCDEPEYDSAGFAEADRTPDSQYEVIAEVDPQDAIVRAQTITFTYDELIDFATRLTRRTVDACKEAVELATFDDSDICDVSLNWDRQIEVEIDNGRIHRDVVDEIEHAADFDESSIDVDVRNVLTDMHLDSIS